MNTDKKEYVLYKGEKFTVEWYYTDKNKSQPFEYFNSLDSQQQMKLLYLVKRMGDFGKISDKTKFNFEEDGIWAFKPKPDRFLSFFTSGKKIIITNAFEKKCQKLPPAEKEKAEKCREDYENRVKGGTYYDNIWSDTIKVQYLNCRKTKEYCNEKVRSKFQGRGIKALRRHWNQEGLRTA